MFVYLIQWEEKKMLNFNFLNKILKSMWFPKAGHKKELEKLEKKFTKWKNEEEN